MAYEGASIELPPTIAIHGVGFHAPGQIQRAVSAALGRASMASHVSEFNWNDYIARSAESIGEGVALLNQLAQSIARTASLPLPSTTSVSDRRLKQLGDHLHNWAFRVLIAAMFTVLAMGPLIQLLMLLPTIAFTSIVWPDVRWLGTVTLYGLATAAIVLVSMLVVDAIRSTTLRSSAPLRVAARRGGLLVLEPLILLLTIPVSGQYGKGLVTCVVGFIPTLIVGALLNLVLSPLSGQFGVLVAGVVATVPVLAVATGLGGAHVLARRLWVGGPLKIVLDIVRYMGSPEYRATLQQAFDGRIRGLEVKGAGERRVLLLAHSLGSVIALDSLVNSKEWRPTDSVDLITLGSPIRRSFIRFFPRYLFPASVEEAARAVASRVRRFCWINVHRRFDYVGTKLGLDREGLGQDRCTGEAYRILRSHSDYWSDDLVMATIRKGMQDAKPVVAGPSRSTTPSHVIPDAEEPRHMAIVANYARALAIVLIAGMVGMAAVSFTRAWTTSVNDLKTSLAELVRTGNPKLADVTYHRTREGAGEDSYYRHHFVFAVYGSASPLAPIEIDDGATDLRFDYRKLAAFILENCSRSEEKPWWQILRSTKEIPCTRSAIAIVADENKPGLVSLPDFEPRPTGTWQAIGEAIGLLIAGIFFALGCGLLILGGGLRLFRLLLGLSASSVELERRSVVT